MTPEARPTTLVVSSEAGPGRARTCEPITVGIPMPRGLVTEPRQIALVDGDGKPVPLQALPTERWPDGSVRWALLDFQANGAGGRRQPVRADLPWPHDGIACAAPASDGNRRTSRHRHRRGAIRAAAGDGVSVLGRDRRRQGARSTRPAARSSSPTSAADRGAHESRRSRSRIAASCGRACGWTGSSAPVTGRFCSSSPGCTSLPDRRRRACRSRSETRAARGTAAASGSWAITDRSTSRTPRSTSFCRRASRRSNARPNADLMPQRFGRAVRAGAGFERRREVAAPDHVNRHGEVPCTFRGYRLRAGDETRAGLRATPAVTRVARVRRRARGGRTLLAELPEGDRGGSRTPARCASSRASTPTSTRSRAASRRRTVFTLAFGDDPMSRDAAGLGPRAADRGGAARVVLQPPARSRYLTPASRDPTRATAQLVDAAIEGADTFERKREVDRRVRLAPLRRHLRRPREPVQRPGRRRSSRTTTTSTTRSAASAAQFMRTGDARWWRLMDELAPTSPTSTSTTPIATRRPTTTACSGTRITTSTPARRRTARIRAAAEGVCGGGPAERAQLRRRACGCTSS